MRGQACSRNRLAVCAWVCVPASETGACGPACLRACMGARKLGRQGGKRTSEPVSLALQSRPFISPLPYDMAFFFSFRVGVYNRSLNLPTVTARGHGGEAEEKREGIGG